MDSDTFYKHPFASAVFTDMGPYLSASVEHTYTTYEKTGAFPPKVTEPVDAIYGWEVVLRLSRSTYASIG